MRLSGVIAVLAVGLATSASQEASADGPPPVQARVTASSVVLTNGLVERRWDRSPFRTSALADLRGKNRIWSRDRRDFTLTIAGSEIGSDQFNAHSVRTERLPGAGMRVVMELSSPLGPALTATRVADAYPGVAGIRTQTILHPGVGISLGAATLDEAAVGAAAPTLHAFRAGADWREPGYSGPTLFAGDPHAGTWRDTHTAGRGQPLAGAGQWLSVADGPRTAFLVMERNDFPSSRAAYDGSVASLRVEYQRDVINLGPFEEQAHFENPSDGPGGRQHALAPGRAFALEPAFVGLGLTEDDEAWQYHRYLTGPRGANYGGQVAFNSNGTDNDRISTGAKDDMDLATIQQVAPLARRLGIDTFVLDDGWQAISGDWEPDSPQHPEPRWDGSPSSKFKPRFPDDRFDAVRRAIAPMRLGLWMSPMSFNPNSATYKAHRDWACKPLGDGTALANSLDPESGSNEAGIGLWSPAAIPHVESRIREAIEQWGVTYFKFDFLVWLDCAGAGDLYDYKDAFVAMLDRLRHDHPGVTFQIDETNDYRLFPFESAARGPTWFQNGTPAPDRLLHNLWNLSPWVPAAALGQHFLGGRQWETYPVDTLMAAALLSHMTFFSDLRQVPARVLDAARPWVAFYRRHHDLLSGVAYPLQSDPVRKGWTALQSWDPERARGALLAFRQESGDPTRKIALRNVPPRRLFKILTGPDDEPVGSVTSAQLSDGIEVRLPKKRQAKVLLILPARGGGGSCDRRPISLVSARVRGRRVVLRGRVSHGLAGRRVVVAGNYRRARATVKSRPSGAFTAGLRRPPRSALFRARFRARTGRYRSASLKLFQALRSTSLRRRGRVLVLRGRIKRSLLGRRHAVVVKRLLCGRYRRMGSTRPNRRGRYVVRFRVPEYTPDALYRAETRVRARPGSRRYVKAYARAIGLR